MEEIRCSNCSKKLAMANFTRLHIKCPRCKTINYLSAQSPEPEHPRVSTQQGGAREKTAGKTVPDR